MLLKLRKLETNTPGTLYLHSMPGRYEPIADFLAAIKQQGIMQIICLTSDEESEEKSPDYAKAIAEKRITAKRVCFPIPDFGTPKDMVAFYALVRETAEELRIGTNILVHCAGGIGRTGTFAGCILKALGLSQDALEESGSGPEDEEQDEIIHRFNHLLR